MANKKNLTTICLTPETWGMRQELKKVEDFDLSREVRDLIRKFYSKYFMVS